MILGFDEASRSSDARPQTDPEKGWSTILRLYSPLEPFFAKEWRAGEIELVP